MFEADMACLYHTMRTKHEARLNFFPPSAPGARKWQISMEATSLTFKQAILNIYPRLRSVIGYNLWTISKDRKTFERLPEKVTSLSSRGFK